MSRGHLGVLLLIIFLPLWMLTTGSDWPGRFGDGSSYVAVAEGLLSGAGYTELEQADWGPELKYPPTFPLLLAIGSLLGGGSTLGYQAVTALLAAGTLLLLTLNFRKYGPFMAILLLANGFWLSFSTHIMTEVPFCFFMVALAVLMERFTVLEELNSKQRLLLAFTIAAAVSTRTVAVVLGAVLLPALWKSRLKFKEWMLPLVYSGLAAVPFFLYIVLTGSGYKGDVAAYPGVPAVLAQNAPYYFKNLSFMLGFSFTSGSVLVNLLLLAIVIWGAVQRCREGQFFETGSVLIFVGVFLVWPFQDARFLLPLAPFFYLFLVMGLESFLREKRALLAAVGILLCIQTFQLHNRLGPVWSRGALDARPQVVRWLNQNARPGDVICSDWDGLWLQCRVRIMPLPQEDKVLKQTEAWLENIHRTEAKWLHIQKDPSRGKLMSLGEDSSQSESRLLKVVSRWNSQFKKVYESEREMVFEVVGDRSKTLQAVGWYRAGHARFFTDRTGYEQFAKALELEPALPTARFFLANQLYAAGHRDQAVEQLKALLYFQPHFEDAKKMLKAWESAPKKPLEDQSS